MMTVLVVLVTNMMLMPVELMMAVLVHGAELPMGGHHLHGRTTRRMSSSAVAAGGRTALVRLQAIDKVTSNWPFSQVLASDSISGISGALGSSHVRVRGHIRHVWHVEKVESGVGSQ